VSDRLIYHPEGRLIHLFDSIYKFYVAAGETPPFTIDKDEEIVTFALKNGTVDAQARGQILTLITCIGYGSAEIK
jgi:hypothetical protein